MGERVICAICLDLLSNEREVPIHPAQVAKRAKGTRKSSKIKSNISATCCGHLLHTDCLQEWFDTSKRTKDKERLTCPTCNGVMRSHKLLNIYISQTEGTEHADSKEQVEQLRQENEDLKTIARVREEEWMNRLEETKKQLTKEKEDSETSNRAEKQTLCMQLEHLRKEKINLEGQLKQKRHQWEKTGGRKRKCEETRVDEATGELQTLKTKTARLETETSELKMENATLKNSNSRKDEEKRNLETELDILEAANMELQGKFLLEQDQRQNESKKLEESKECLNFLIADHGELLAKYHQERYRSNILRGRILSLQGELP